MDFSPTGHHLAVTDLSHLQIFNLRTGEVSFEAKYDALISDVAFMPDGNTIALALGEDGLVLIDPSDQSQPEQRRFKGSWDRVQTYADGSGLYGANWEKLISVQLTSQTIAEIDKIKIFPVYVFDGQGTPTHTQQNYFAEFTTQDDFAKAIHDPFGKRMSAAMLYQSNATRHFGLIYVDPTLVGQTPILAYSNEQDPRLQDFRTTPHGPRAVVWQKSSDLHQISVTDPTTKRTTFSLEFEPDTYARYGAATLSPDGQMVALHHQNGWIDIFATDDLDNDHFLAQKSNVLTAPTIVLSQGHSGLIKGLDVSSDGKLFATVGTDSRVHIWETATGRRIRSIAEGEHVYTASFSPDSSKILTVGLADGFKLWTVSDGKFFTEMLQTPAVVWGAYFGNDGLIIACGTVSCDVGTEQEFRANQATVLKTPKIISMPSFNAASVSADGLYAAVLLDDGTLFVVDAKTQSLTSMQLPKDTNSFALGFGGAGVLNTKDGLLIEFDVTTRILGATHQNTGKGVDRITPISAGTYLLSASSPVHLSEPDNAPVRFIFDTKSQARTGDFPAPPKALGIGAAGPVVFDPTAQRVIGVAQSGWGGDPQIDLWDLAETADVPAILRQSITPNIVDPRYISFSNDGNTLFVNGSQNAVHWNLHSGKVDLVRGSGLFQNSVAAGNGVVYLDTQTPSQRLHFQSEAQGERPIIWDKAEGWYSGPDGLIISNGTDIILSESKMMAQFTLQEIAENKKKTSPKSQFEIEGGSLSDPPILSPDGTKIVSTLRDDGENKLRAYDTKTGAVIWEHLNENDLDTFAFSPDGTRIFFGDNGGQYLVSLDATTGNAQPIHTAQNHTDARSLMAVNRFGVGKMMRLSGDNQIQLLNDDGTQSPYSIGRAAVSPVFAKLNSGGDMALIAGYDGKNLLWDWNRDLIHPINANATGPNGIAFSPDGALMALVETSGLISLWQIETGTRLMQLAMLRDGGWAVIGADGRYDASDPGNFPALGWVMPDTPNEALPVELFYREFFEPNLLPRLLNAETFAPLPDLPTLNRQQPLLAFSGITHQSGPQNEVSVSIKVSSTAKEDSYSGVSSVKLFRDGQLVGLLGDDQKELIPQSDGEKTITLHFENVLLPPNDADTQVLFEAYAFNSDGVKSRTIRQTYAATAPQETAPRTAFVISIGVDSYDNSAWDLNYAGADAALSADAIAARLRSQKGFDDVVALSLLSSNAQGLHHANRATIEAVLETLGSGKDVPVELQAIPGIEKLRRAQPQDMVYLFFAGHGFAGQDGLFHLFPQDIGTGASGRVVNDALLAKTLDSDRLSHLFRHIQARDMILIIDACNSAAAVEGSTFKPGPMGSKGLGQLAYDKGMRVLTASQAEGVALESSLLRHGALSYALFREGLEGTQADTAPVDQRVSFSELLKFAENRVPVLYQEIVSNTFEPKQRGSMVLDFAVSGGVEKQTRSTRYSQRPSLFDFKRKTGPDTIFLGVK